MLTGCQKLSEAFNDHFASIGPKLSNKIHSNEGIRSYSEYLTCCQNRATLQLKETRPSIVFSPLSKLSVSKATGLDKISAKLLRLCPDLIADSLCSNFNRSINTGIFPEE